MGNLRREPVAEMDAIVEKWKKGSREDNGLTFVIGPNCPPSPFILVST